MQFASGRGTSSSGIVVVVVLVALAILAGALAFRSQPFTSWGFDFFGLLTHSRDQHVASHNSETADSISIRFCEPPKATVASLPPEKPPCRPGHPGSYPAPAWPA